MMKKKYLLITLLSIFSLTHGQSVIGTIDRANGPGPTATGNTSSISSLGLSRGSGITQGSAVNFSTEDWDGVNQEAAELNNEYIEWSITANTSFEVDVTELDLRLRRSSNGPVNWQLFYSLDNFTTAGIAVNTVQNMTITSSITYNINSLNINSGNSGTITFRIYAWGASSTSGWLRVIGQGSWNNYGITNPGIRFRGNITTSTTNSIDSDIIATSFFFPPENNIDYTTYNVTNGLTLFNSIALGEFTIRDGGAAGTDTDNDGTVLTDIQFSITNSENISALAIFDGLTNIAEKSSVTPLTNFNGINLSTADNGTKTFFVFATFKPLVTDNQQVQLTINTVSSATSGSSLFADANAGGSATSITGDDNRIEVSISQFQFNQQPTDGNQFEAIFPSPTISAVDANLNIDVDANIANISVLSAGSSINSDTYNMVNGHAVLNNIIYSETETSETFSANGSTFTTGDSNSFNINGPLTTISEQNFDDATNWTYTSDRTFFGTVSDWGDVIGYFGEIALANASPIDNSLFSNNIFGENDLNDVANPYASLTFENIDISLFNDVQIKFDWQVVGYSTNTNDLQYRLILDDVLQPLVTFFDGNVDSINDDQGRISIDIPDGTSTVSLVIRIRNSSPSGYSGFDNFRVVSEFNGLIYTASDGWKDNIEPDGTTGTQDALVIDGTYNVSGDVQLDNLIIRNGATTVIDFGESITTNTNLINNGTLELNSISNNYSSLIVGGAIESEVIYNRHVNQFANSGSTTGNNDLISPPVTNNSQTFLALRTTNTDIPSGTIGGVPSFLFGPYNNISNNYINYTASDDSSIITSGIGYRTASNTPSGDTFRFVGNVETGSKTVPISVGAGSDFNLIGNPYPSYISLSGFLASNNEQFNPTSSGIYGYNGGVTEGFIILNQAYSDANPSALIAPGQGFFVASKAGGGSIDFLPTMRSIGTSDDFIAGRSILQNLAHLKLKATNNNSIYKTDFYFNDNASLGMDSGYDSAIFNNISPEFAMYSRLVEDNSGINMTVQSVSYSDLASVTIPLGINAIQGEQVTISIDESNIPEGTTVILEDNVSNSYTDLQSSDFIFTPTTTLTNTGRFFLHFTSQRLNVSENILNGLEIYTSTTPKEIIIKGQLGSQTKLTILDIQGRVVSYSSLNPSSTTHALDVSNLNTGVYIIQLQNATANRTQKIILN